MVKDKMFLNFKSRDTGRTTRNVKVAVWGAVFGKTSTFYVPRHILKDTIIYGIKAECEESGLNYEEVMKFIEIVVPRLEGRKADLNFVDNSFEDAYTHITTPHKKAHTGWEAVRYQQYLDKHHATRAKLLGVTALNKTEEV